MLAEALARPIVAIVTATVHSESSNTKHVILAKRHRKHKFLARGMPAMVKATE